MVKDVNLLWKIIINNLLLSFDERRNLFQHDGI